MEIQVSRFDDERLRAEIEAGRTIPAPVITPANLVDQLVHRSRSGAGLGFDALESFLGENDLVETNYLERGLMAARTVCRLNVAALAGDSSDWGTGFLIGPRLLLTNSHVIGTETDAQRATVEFGYELDAGGRLRRTTRFRLTPEDGWVSSPRSQLDYTIVAVAERSEDGMTPISDFGYLRLVSKTGKVEVGQFVTIIQHPGSGTKRVSLRENKVVKHGDGSDPERDNFLWYSSDTAPGSSGAPVCTDAWQVVCLHHAGVPERQTVDGAQHWVLSDGTTAPAEIARALPAEKVRWRANEGVRASRIIADVTQQAKQAGLTRRPLVDAFVQDTAGTQPFAGTIAGQSIVGPALFPSPTILTLGSAADTRLADEAARRPTRHTRPAGYFDTRKGYQDDFLATVLPLPTLSAAALRHGDAAKVTGAVDDILRYLHFSIMFNGNPKRRIAFFTAVNIDGERWNNLDRGNDVWYYDPRIAENLQNGDELYGNEPVPAKNYFDRGHLVRRLDPVWGDVFTAKQANDDTFYWPNCSPQYWGFNQGQDLWQGLENFLLYNTDTENVRATVFSGPILRGDDEEHRGILIPQYFWKIIGVTDRSGTLFSSAYLVSQKDYALNVPFERIPVGPNSDKPGQNFQVPIARIEAETGIVFPDPIRQADVYQGPTMGRRLRTFADIQHPRR